MARKRKEPSAWEKRNAAAKAKGYRNYYDYRVHDYGKRPPDEVVQRAKRAKQSGSRGPAAFKRALKSGNIGLLVEAPRKRGPGGEWQQIAFVAVTTKGEIRDYYIDIDDRYDLDYWHDLIDDAGVDFLEYSSTQATAVA